MCCCPQRANVMGALCRQSAPIPPKPPEGDVSTRPPPGLPLLDQRAGPAGPTLWKPTRGYSTKHRQTARPHSVAAERHEPRPATKCRAKVSYLTGEQPWGVSKEGRPQSAPLWSFQGGVQRGEIEIPPLVSFLGGGACQWQAVPHDRAGRREGVPSFPHGKDGPQKICPLKGET